MKSSDLNAEFLATLDGLTRRARMFLARAGVPFRVMMMDPGPVGLARVTPCAGGTFEFTADGAAAFVSPAWSWAPFEGDVVDLVAWALSDPATWWRRLGSVALLGEYSAAHSAGTGAPLRVHPHPLRWLAAGGEGVVVLEPDGAWGALMQCGSIEAANRAHGKDLRKWLKPLPPHRPKILIPREAL